jgi:hypothetical protein
MLGTAAIAAQMPAAEIPAKRPGSLWQAPQLALYRVWPSSVGVVLSGQMFVVVNVGHYWE